MMNKRIRSLIDELFKEMKMTAENLALRDELMANAQARYEDNLAGGMTEEEAFTDVAASLGDVSELLQHPENEEKTDEKDPFGKGIEMAFGAIGEFGSQIMPHMERFARQADKATGGVFSGIGKAAVKGVMDMGRAAGEAFSWMTQQGEKQKKETPEEMLVRAAGIREKAEEKESAGDQEGARKLRRAAYELEQQAQQLREEAERGEKARKETQGSDETKETRDGEEAWEEAARIAREMTEELDEDDQDLEEPEEEMSPEDIDDLVDEAEKLAEDSLTKQFATEGIQAVEIDLDADDIDLMLSGGKEIEVIWENDNPENDAFPDIRTENGVLRISRKNPDVFKTFFSVFSKDGGRMKVLLPLRFRANVKASTTSGDIFVRDIDAETLKINSTSGRVDIHLRPDTLVRELNANTVSGHARVEASAEKISVGTISGDPWVISQADTVKINTVSGKVHVEGRLEECSIDCVSGDAELVCLKAPAREIRISTLSGSACVRLPSDVRGFTVEAKGLGTKIVNEFGPNRYGTCEFPITFESMSGRMTITRRE